MSVRLLSFLALTMDIGFTCHWPPWKPKVAESLAPRENRPGREHTLRREGSVMRLAHFWVSTVWREPSPQKVLFGEGPQPLSPSFAVSQWRCPSLKQLSGRKLKGIEYTDTPEIRGACVKCTTLGCVISSPRAVGAYCEPQKDVKSTRCQVKPNWK